MKLFDEMIEAADTNCGVRAYSIMSIRGYKPLNNICYPSENFVKYLPFQFSPSFRSQTFFFTYLARVATHF